MPWMETSPVEQRERSFAITGWSCTRWPSSVHLVDSFLPRAARPRRPYLPGCSGVPEAQLRTAFHLAPILPEQGLEVKSRS